MIQDRTILIRNIYYMLAYAFKALRNNNYAHLEGETFEHIHDLFAEILRLGISAQLKHGLHRAYVERTEPLAALRGKIDLAATMRHRMANRRQLECTFDELTEDCLLNRILKSAAMMLAFHPDVAPQRRRALRRLLVLFGGVGDTRLDKVKWNTIRLDRNTQTYSLLMCICRFISRSMLPGTEIGGPLPVFDDQQMSALFENFVRAYFRRHFPEIFIGAENIGWNIVETESTIGLLPRMVTDISLVRGAHRLIIDTKYYSRSLQLYRDKRSVHSANLYQIQSYVINADRDHAGTVDGMLLYARTTEDVIPEGQMRLRGGNVIRFSTLDLGEQFAAISGRLDEIAALV